MRPTPDKFTVLAGLVIATAGLWAVWSYLTQELKGSGVVVSERRDVTGFDKIYCRSDGALLVTQGDTESLTIEADNNLLERIETKVEGGELRIRLWYRGHVTKITPTRLIYHVTVKQLREVTACAKLEAAHLTTDHLKVSTSGTAAAVLTDLTAEDLTVTGQHWGSVSVSGVVERQTVVLYGTTAYRGADLASATATLDIHHSAEATIKVRDRLDVTIHEKGAVAYAGNPPVVNAKVSTSGRIRQL
jgi:hypothetical protein